jgi:putative endonuclease
MGFYLYVIASASGKYYKGVSGHPLLRLVQHNNDEVQSTAGQGPWRFAGVFMFESKREALIQERKLKKYSREKLKNWMSGRENIAGDLVEE